MTDIEIVRRGFRDSNTEARAALARIVEERDAYRASLDAATKRVEELEAERDSAVRGFRMDELDAVMYSVDKWFDDGDARLENNPATRAAAAREVALKAIEKAEARVKVLESALTTRDVKEAIGRFRGVAQFFEIGDMSAECDGNTLADAIEAALAGKGE